METSRTHSDTALCAGQLSFENLIPNHSKKPDILFLWQKWRGLIGKLALAGTVGFGSGAVATPFVWPAEIVAGPHDATVKPNFSGQMTLDLGPADTLTRPSGELFGGTLTIKGLHGDDGNQDTEVIEDIETYANLFDAEKISNDAINALKKRSTEGGLVGSILFMASFFGLYASFDRKGRKELSDMFQRRRKQFTALAASGSIALGGSIGLLALTNSTDTAQASFAFDGTPLEGWTANGSLVRSGAIEFANILERNERNSKLFKANLEKEAKTIPILEADKTSFTVVVIGNTKCNMVLPSSIGEIIRRSRATYFIAAGDLTFSGTSLENSCVSSMAFHTRSVEQVVALGNHSSNETEKKVKEEGFNSLDRKVINVAGRTFIGDDSPRRSVLAQGTISERNETESEMGEAVADKACKQKEPPMFAVVFNEPNAAEPSAKRGCATLVIAASEHSSLVEITHTQSKKTFYFLAGDATGTKPGSINLGEPDNISEITVLKLDKASNELIARQTISFYPNKDVDIPYPQLIHS